MKEFNYCAVKTLLLAALCVGIGSGECSAVGGVKTEIWQFNSDANPTTPEVVTNSPGTAVAVVTPGPFSSLWNAENSLFSGATGVWDLGRNGTIACSGVANFVGAAGQERLFSIKVKQYQDGAFYAERATVLVPGAALQATIVTADGSGTIGGWITEETQWRVPAAATVDQLTVVSAYNGSLVDQLAIEAAFVSQPLPTLVIRQVGTGNQVEVSWPAGFAGMVLEATTNLNDVNGWSLVTAPVQTSGEVSSVILETQADAQFYRLRQP